MQKFRFSKSTPANVAKPAKVSANKANPVAKPLLTIAKVDKKKHNVSNFSKSLARQEPFKKNNISNISNISRGQGVKPEKKLLQKQIDYLWVEANKLVDWADDSESEIPWQKRAAKVPELQEMSIEIDRLKAKKTNGVTIEIINDPTPSQKNVAPTTLAVKLNSICPAKCKVTGRCYGIAYFSGKSGKVQSCAPTQCDWVDQIKHYIERNKK